MADREVRIQIAGMTCIDCEVQITRALERAGATEATADFRRGGVAHARLPENVGEATLTDAVRPGGLHAGASRGDESDLVIN